MSPSLLVTLLVFAPLLGATIAGLFGRRIGNNAAQTVTTGLLFFSAALAWLKKQSPDSNPVKAKPVKPAPASQRNSRRVRRQKEPDVESDCGVPGEVMVLIS